MRKTVDDALSFESLCIDSNKIGAWSITGKEG